MPCTQPLSSPPRSPRSTRPTSSRATRIQGRAEGDQHPLAVDRALRARQKVLADSCEESSCVYLMRYGSDLCMKSERQTAATILRRLGRVRHVRSSDTFEVQTSAGAKWILCPYSNESRLLGILIDELFVPERLRRLGVATGALRALCDLADQCGFELRGGPVGLSEDPWGRRFSAWVLRFGFEPDPSPTLPRLADPNAIYVWRPRRLDQRAKRLPKRFRAQRPR